MKISDKFVDAVKIDLEIDIGCNDCTTMSRLITDTFDEIYVKGIRRDERGVLAVTISIGESTPEGFTEEIGEVRLVGWNHEALHDIYNILSLEDMGAPWDVPYSVLEEEAKDREAFEEWRERMLETMF